MQNPESGLTPLDPMKHLPPSVRKWLRDIVVIGGLVGGGMGIGYWAGVRQEHEDRLAEIARLSAVYEASLARLGVKVGEAADTAAAAADAASAAATRADVAVQQANRNTSPPAPSGPKPGK